MSDGEKHAFLAPSDAEGWMNCAGKASIQETLPRTSSTYADEGTEAHDWGAQCLQLRDTTPYAKLLERAPEHMREPVGLYVQAVLDAMEAYRAAGATHVELHVEQKLPLEGLTGEKDATGKGDAIILAAFPAREGAQPYSAMEVWDLKFGVGVPVPVKDNKQLQMYGLGAFFKYSQLRGITEVHLVIHQVRISPRPQRWQVSPAQLFSFADKVALAARKALALRGSPEALKNLTPGDAQCRWCAFKARCPAFADYVSTAVASSIAADAEQKERAAYLGAARQKLELVRSWCDAVESESDALALSGVHVPGWKVVDGREGNRAWKADAPPQVEKILRLFGYEDAVIKTKPVLLSPTQMEELLHKKGGKAGKRLWAVLSPDPKQKDAVTYITRSAPKPAVVEESDPRPAKSSGAEASDFEDPGDQRQASVTEALPSDFEVLQ